MKCQDLDDLPGSSKFLSLTKNVKSKTIDYLNQYTYNEKKAIYFLHSKKYYKRLKI